MGTCKSDVFRDRFQELYSTKIDEICAELNSEFDERFYVMDNKIYVDCSDFSRIDVKIS